MPLLFHTFCRAALISVNDQLSEGGGGACSRTLEGTVCPISTSLCSACDLECFNPGFTVQFKKCPGALKMLQLIRIFML